jgi:hypothetical protein
MRGFYHVKYLEVSDVKNLGQIGKLPFGKLSQRNPRSNIGGLEDDILLKGLSYICLRRAQLLVLQSDRQIYYAR